MRFMMSLLERPLDGGVKEIPERGGMFRRRFPQRPPPR
jgi:hypothetical protein